MPLTSPPSPPSPPFQIRNVGAMGSNVANASPISDLNPVLATSNCFFFFVCIILTPGDE